MGEENILLSKMKAATDKTSHFFDWSSVLENRKNTVRMNEAFKLYNSIKNDNELLYSFCLDFIQQCHAIINRNKLSTVDVFISEDFLTLFEMIYGGMSENFEEIVYFTICRISDAVEKANQSETLIDRIKLYIDIGIKDNASDLTRNGIAKRFFIHSNYLSHLFKEKTGMTFSRYICNKRIEYAKQLLTETEELVSKICNMSGFDNAAYFSKIFKRETGITPTEYRNMFTANKY